VTAQAVCKFEASGAGWTGPGAKGQNVVVAGEVSASELYRFMLKNREVVDGRLMCRAAIFPYLEGRGVAKPQGLRTRLVHELEGKGLVKRVHPQSRHVLIL
jgi:hypothetical protein